MGEGHGGQQCCGGSVNMDSSRGMDVRGANVVWGENAGVHGGRSEG